MDWVEYEPPAKLDAISTTSTWHSDRVDIEDTSQQFYLLIEFSADVNEFLSDYQRSTVVVAWQTDTGINMNTALVQVLRCRRRTIPTPAVELWCKMTKLYACVRFKPVERVNIPC